MALQKKILGTASIVEIHGGWRFDLQASNTFQYRLAQLDDYHGLDRGEHQHRPPLRLSVRARSSQAELPGTWGFGLWNDPFGLSLGFGSAAGRLPTLPNAAWFFFASRENHLSLRDAQPGNGQMVGAYRSPHLPSVVLAPSLLGIPFALIPPISRLLRRVAARVIRHELATFDVDATQWHEYVLLWLESSIEFQIDGRKVYETTANPQPPLGLVLWLDNQYAAWRPDGRLQYGLLPTPANCWVEITDLQLSRP